METKTTAPKTIAPDTYAGRHTCRFGPKTQAFGYYLTTMTAGDIAAESPEGVIWESAGTPRGSRRELVGRARYVADDAGNLHVYNSEGRKTLIHPADRKLRVMRQHG